MSLFKFKVSYHNDEKLPYSCDDLALALHYLYLENQKQTYIPEPIMTQIDKADNIVGDDDDQIKEKNIGEGYLATYNEQEMDKLKAEVEEMKQ